MRSSIFNKNIINPKLVDELMKLLEDGAKTVVQLGLKIHATAYPLR